MEKSKKSSRKSKRQLAKALLDLFQNNPSEEYGLNDLARILGLKTHPSKMMCTDILADLMACRCFVNQTRNHIRTGAFLLHMSIIDHNNLIGNLQDSLLMGND